MAFFFVNGFKSSSEHLQVVVPKVLVGEVLVGNHDAITPGLHEEIHQNTGEIFLAHYEEICCHSCETL